MRKPSTSPGSLFLSLSASLLALGCQTSGRPTSFTSAGLPGAGGSRDLAAVAPDASAQAPRAVEEADIVKSDGGHLYVVNAYRGLNILDVADPDHPKLLGRAPILGHPVDMYLANGLAYVIVSDYFNWWWDPQAGLSSFHGSEIKVVDVGDPAAPRVLSSFQLEGFISDTRRVGDVIYAVSNVYSWITNPNAPQGQADDSTFVVSIDVANPMRVAVVDRLDFPGSSNRIHATSDSLFVAQPRWDQVGGRSEGATRVQFVDIRDPHGKMVLGGTAEVPGYLDSKFQMDARETVLRLLTHDGGWGPTGAQRLSTLEVKGGQLTPLGRLDLPASGGLFGVRFDGDRAYFATFVSKDPLEIVDLADPTRPTLEFSLTIPGTLHQIVPRGDRLLALGSEDDTWRGVQVSLFDVADARKPALLSSAPVGGANMQAWTQAFWDDKALKVIDALGLIAVPFQAWEPNLARPTQGLQLVDFSRSTVAARGRIEQPGAILRTLEVGSRLGTLSELSFAASDISDRDHPRVVATVELVRNVVDFARVTGGGVQLLGPKDYWLDGEHLRLRTVTMGHVDDGQLVAELPLASSSGRMIQSGDLLYVVGSDWDRNSGAYHLKVQVADASDLAKPRLRGDLEVPMDPNSWWYGLWGYGPRDPGVVLVDGRLLVFLGQRSFQGNNGQWSYTQTLGVVDVSNPDAPAFASSVDLGATWSFGLIADGRRVYLTHAEDAGQDPDGLPIVKDFMDRIDLQDPAHPTILPSVNIPGLLMAVREGGRRIFTVDYQWAQKVPVNSFDTLTVDGDTALLDQALLVPAQISRVELSGDEAYFTSQTWPLGQTPQPPRTTLHTVDVSQAAAGQMVEVSQNDLAGAYTLREVQAGHLFLETGGWWWWGPYALAGGAPVADVAIGAPCFSDGGFGCGYGGGGDHLAIFDLADPAHPAFRGAARLNGWITSLCVDGNTAYLPSGFYGVQSLSL